MGAQHTRKDKLDNMPLAQCGAEQAAVVDANIPCCRRCAIIIINY